MWVGVVGLGSDRRLIFKPAGVWQIFWGTENRKIVVENVV